MIFESDVATEAATRGRFGLLATHNPTPSLMGLRQCIGVCLSAQAARPFLMKSIDGTSSGVCFLRRRESEKWAWKLVRQHALADSCNLLARVNQSRFRSAIASLASGELEVHSVFRRASRVTRVRRSRAGRYNSLGLPTAAALSPLRTARTVAPR